MRVWVVVKKLWLMKPAMGAMARERTNQGERRRDDNEGGGGEEGRRQAEGGDEAAGQGGSGHLGQRDDGRAEGDGVGDILFGDEVGDQGMARRHAEGEEGAAQEGEDDDVPD